jgi:hypothetical protein
MSFLLILCFAHSVDTSIHMVDLLAILRKTDSTATFL